MGKILSGIFPGIGLYGYLAAFILGATLSGSATYYIVHNANAVEILSLQKAIETKRADDNAASLTQLQGFIASIHNAETNYNDTLDAIAASVASLKGVWKNATQKPLPKDCLPDVERMRAANAAILSANKATGAAP
jgi:hypothetical protein